MNLLSKEVLIGAASLGAGAVAAKVVQKKVLPLIPVDAFKTNPTVQNLTTLVAGILTPTIVKSPIGKGLGAGMIAVSVAGLVDPLLSTAGLTGYRNNYMGDVFLGEMPESSSTLMGASDSVESPSTDYTSGDAGEMDF